ncbi:MAG TPA: hypothetical protein VGE26_11345, partial [Sphingobacteriaceae bacterium]
MNYTATYKAAKEISETVAAHFSNHVARAAERREQNFAQAPDRAVIEALIDIAFWTSLRKEEGISPRIS